MHCELRKLDTSFYDSLGVLDNTFYFSNISSHRTHDLRCMTCLFLGNSFGNQRITESVYLQGIWCPVKKTPIFFQNASKINLFCQFNISSVCHRNLSLFKTVCIEKKHKRNLAKISTEKYLQNTIEFKMAALAIRHWRIIHENNATE